MPHPGRLLWLQLADEVLSFSAT
ncbi:hypothetical protein LCGC14_1719530, partial [marine sediment metagenome]